MPRGRGGSRQGKPGASYTNRTDLNAPKPAIAVAPSAGYGQAQSQLAAQQAVPVGPAPTQQPIPGQMDARAAAHAAAPGFAFPQLSPFNAPTDYPDEPVTAGASQGMGPGREVLGLPDNSIEASLRALYKSAPNSALRELIEELETERLAR